MPAYTLERTSEKTKVVVNSEGKIVRNHTTGARVTPGADVSTADVADNLGLRPGGVHPNDSSATLRTIGVDRQTTRDAFAAFDVVLDYSTDAPQPDTGDDNPVNQKTKRSQGVVEQTFYIVKDRSGNAIVNAARQPPAGGVPVSMLLPTFIYEKNLATYDRTFVSSWMNALNNASFNGCDAETLRLGITATEEWQGVTKYWAMRFEMAFNPLGWQPSFVNSGLLEKADPAEGNLKPILDPHTLMPVTSPWPLYPSSSADRGKSLPTNYAVADINFIDVDHFNLKDFSTLGLKEF